MPTYNKNEYSKLHGGYKPLAAPGTQGFSDRSKDYHAWKRRSIAKAIFTIFLRWMGGIVIATILVSIVNFGFGSAWSFDTVLGVAVVAGFLSIFGGWG